MLIKERENKRGKKIDLWYLILFLFFSSSRYQTSIHSRYYISHVKHNENMRAQYCLGFTIFYCKILSHIYWHEVSFLILINHFFGSLRNQFYEYVRFYNFFSPTTSEIYKHAQRQIDQQREKLTIVQVMLLSFSIRKIKIPSPIGDIVL